MRVSRAGLHFEVTDEGPGDGPPVLLLHGFPQDASSFDAVAALLVAAGCRVLRYDQRGYAPAARPVEVAAYGLAEVVQDAVAVLDAAGVTAGHLVGHDWGSQVAWALAAWSPERVASLTAVSVPHPTAYGRAVREDPEQGERSAYIGLFRQDGGVAESILLADDGRRLRRIYEPLPEPAARRYVERFSAPGALTGGLNWYRAMGVGPRRPVPAVEVPTTFVWSTGDVFVGRVAADLCAAQVTGDYRLVELPGVSHWIPDQAPTELAAAVLARVRPR